MSDCPIKMVKIPAGKFLMGASRHDLYPSPSELPRVEVTLESFLISETTITQRQWEIVANWEPVDRPLKHRPSYFKESGLPVEQVSWHDAMEFCARLRRKTRVAYTLPTEAQWEYACRAGTTSDYSFGNSLTPDRANFDTQWDYLSPFPEGKEQTVEGRFYPPNGWGVFGMHGNVFEWCLDSWYGTLKGMPQDGSARIKPVDPALKAVHAVRGGGWMSPPQECRSSARRGVQHYSDGCSDVGFRVVAPAPPEMPMGPSSKPAMAKRPEPKGPWQ